MCHYIPPGRCKPVFLLLTFLIYFSGWILAATAPPNVTNVVIHNVTESSMTVTWTAPTSGNITQYIVAINNGSDTVNKTTDRTSYTVNDLLPGVIYNITVYSVNVNGTSINGVSEAATTRPSPVSGFGASVRGMNSVFLNWTIPNDTNSKSYTYNVLGQPGNVNITNITTNFVQVTGLSPGVNYKFTIYTVTSDRVRSATAPETQRTTRPSPVSDFHAPAAEVNSVNLNWTIPNDTNSKTYTYNVLGQPDNVNITNITTNYVQVTGLSPGVNYKFTIYTVTSDGVRSEAVPETQKTTRPSPVSGFGASAVGVNTVNLIWTFPNDINSKSYTYNVLGQPGNVNINITTNYVQVTGLSPGVNYKFTIYTVTSDGVRSEAVPETQRTTRPSPVSGFVASAAGMNSVFLNWTIPNDTNNKTYTYNVLGQPGNVNITNITTNFVQVTGLSPGVNYKFTIYTVTSDGEQSATAPETQRTTKPSSVSDFHASAVGVNSVNLNWMIPNNTNSKSYTYTVLWQPDNVNITNITTNYVQVTGLSPGVNYKFTIYTVTSDGVRSEAVQETQNTTKPSSVSDFHASAVGVNSVNLNWRIPNNTNSKSYTYTVLWQPDNVNITNITTNYVQVTGLSPGVNYKFTIYTVTSDGVRSEAVQETQNTTRPSAVSSFGASTAGVNTVILNWTIPSDTNSKSYTYNVLGQPGNVSIINITTNFVEVTGLSPGVNYKFTIYTVTSDGVLSEAVPETQRTTMPNKPKSLRGVNFGVSELIINWTSPGDPNVQLYNYQVTWINIQNQTQQQNITATTKDTNFTIMDLFPGNLYSITVTSVISNTLSADSLINMRTNPVAAKTLTVSNITNTKATLQWILPDNYNNSYQSGYEIEYQIKGGIVQSINIANTSCVLENLVPGNQYIFTVITVASTAVPGRRRRSVSPDIVTRSTGTTTQDETVPNPVVGPHCSKVDGYQIKVTFKCPYGNYSLFEVSVNSKSNTNTNSCTNDVIISNLQPANSYKISIRTLAIQKTSITELLECSTDSTGVIVGSIFGVLLFLLLIGLIVFFVMKKRRTKDLTDNRRPSRRKFHSIPTEKFREHYDRNHADSDFGFAEEYQELSSVGTTQSKRAAEMQDNRSKNRFTNVLPYDHSRVKLTIDGIASTDYINANYMPGYNSTKEFIASQGPLPNTTADFWRMIWEHHVNTIVMLTNCMESGRAKCEHYWPLDYTPCTYEDITVAVTSETILSEWTIRDFSVKHAKQQGIKYVRHFHFTAWPDHGVPDSTSSIIEFRNLVREHMDQRKSNGPSIVHCSAGVGRTGTLIALDYLIQQMEKEHRIGTYCFVEKMRMNRTLMVQTEAQYVFLNKCMLDLIEQPPEENIYENQMGNELIYENASAVRNFQNEKVEMQTIINP